MAKEKQSKRTTLAMYLINEINGDSYRAGTLSGTKHPRIDEKMIRNIGSLPELIRQAKELKEAGLIDFRLENMGADIERIHVPVDSVKELCERENIEDPRRRQLRYIEMMEQRLSHVGETFLAEYYREILERLKRGKQVLNIDLEDENYFLCLQEIATMKTPMWMRIFSAGVLGSSKKFKDEYQAKVVSVLTRYSPLYEEGMEENEILSAHGIKTYSHTIEWKGSLQYEEYYQDGKKSFVDSSKNKYGTILNEQTMEHAVPVSTVGVKRILVIENKANYEEMSYEDDTLYLYCHGFYSPKEREFLRKLVMIAGEDTEYFHWGDLDFGGMRIFKYNREQIFPALQPYKMDRVTFLEAIKWGAGIPLEDKKREKLEKFQIEQLDLKDLTELKKCILDTGLEIEQEILIAHKKLKTQFIENA